MTSPATVLPIKKNSFEGVQQDGDPVVLASLCTEYFTTRGLDNLEEAEHFGFIPMFDTDPRLDSIATVVKHRERQGSEPIPGFMVEYRDEKKHLAFRYLCDEADYPFSVNTQKKVKLAVQSGVGVIPFMPHGIDWENLPVGTKVHVCESALKAAVLCKRGRPAVGLNGVYTWSKEKRITPELIRMFRVRGWIPVITFDANAHPGPAHNPNVAKAQSSFISALFSVCACQSVFICPVPHNTIYDQGIDDYFGAGGELSALDAATYEVDSDGTRPLASADFGSFLQQEFSIPEPIVEGFIGKGECNLLVSPPKAGKTRLAFTAAVQIASGKGPLLGIPQFTIPSQSRVLLVILEDAGYNIQQSLATFCHDLGIKPSQLATTLRLVTGIPQGSDILVKLDGEVKKFKPDICIIDNLTRVEMIEGRVSTEASPLQREYQKVDRFTSWGRSLSIAMLMLAHSKKGASTQHNVSDKTNSTGTMAGAADNLASIERIHEKHDLPDEYRKFVTNARSYRDVEVVVEVGSGPTMFIADWKTLDLTALQQRYLVALYQLSKGNDGYIPASAIAERTGVKSVQTVRNALSRMSEKGFVNPKEGIDGGYKLSPAGIEAVEIKKCT